MPGDPYSGFIQCMRKEGSHNNGFDLMACPVIKDLPMMIQYNGVPIGNVIVCNTCTKDYKIPTILSGETLSESVKEFLAELYEIHTVKVGDTVLVQRVADKFYMIGKVTK